MIRRLLCLVPIAIAAGCASVHQVSGPGSKLGFEMAKSILPSYKNQEEVVRHLGKPSSIKIQEGGGEVWNYNEGPDLYQRLTLAFDQSKKLATVLWIPNPGEPETSLQGIASHYPSAALKRMEVREVSPPHDYNTESIYSDGKSLSVHVNDSNKFVYAISWSREPNDRVPSVNPASDKNAVRTKVDF